MERSAVSLVVLAGGRASRLGGVRKPLVEVGGRPILRRVLDELGPLAAEHLVLADQPLAIDGARVLVDAEAHAGVLPALEQGLSEASGEVCVIVAGDMPFVSRAAFGYLLERMEGVDVVVPRVDGILQPMHAVIRREPAHQATRAALVRGESRLFRVLETLKRLDVTEAELRRVDPDLRSLFNVNTPEDLAAATRPAARSET
jgi:molybdenum cofactor guanylyltransferase